MSDRQIAKNRHHKGETQYLRRTMKKVGISLDEEMAQFALSGKNPFQGDARSYLAEVVDMTLSNRFNLNRQWEAENPGRNPFPPSFPERALKVVRAALEELNNGDEGNPALILSQLEVMCLKELEASNETIEADIDTNED